MRFENIILLHGKGGSPHGSVAQLQAELERHGVVARFERPRMPHSDPDVLAERSVDALIAAPPPAGSLVIGISLGGLVAAKMQADVRIDDLHVIAISSPTWADGVKLGRKLPNRASIFGTNDDVIAGRTSAWPQLADAYEFPWLTHDTDAHKVRLAELVRAYIDGGASGLGECAARLRR